MNQENEEEYSRPRDRCTACPWLDMEAMERGFPDVVGHARQDPTGFVCHTRCGPCDGPRVALREGVTAGASRGSL